MYQTWNWLKMQLHVHELLCSLCYLNMWMLISPLSVVLHWNSASNYIDTTVLAAPGSDVLISVLCFLSSVYMHTSHNTVACDSAATLISNMHWSGNMCNSGHAS